VTNWTWDSYGNLKSETDPNNVLTVYNYDSNNLYLQQKVQAWGTPVGRAFNYVWDNHLGLLTSKTDVNNSTTTNYGYDPQGRQTNVTEAYGQLGRQTQTTYDDANRQVTVKRDQTTSGDGALASVTSYDQLYRPTLTQQFGVAEPCYPGNAQTSIKVQTRYLYSGNNSYKLVSNPYCGTTNLVAAAATQFGMGWHVTTYDQNGRSTSSETFNASGLPAPWGSNTTNWGSVTTTYSANTTTVTDEAGVARQTTIDGAGRLSQVLEDPLGLKFNTSYTYDALDNLTG
jgi:hypothetical protein